MDSRNGQYLFAVDMGSCNGQISIGGGHGLT